MKKESPRSIDCAATGGRICYYAMLFGYNLKELGYMTGCSEGAVRKWLRGTSIPSPKHLKQLSEMSGSTAAVPSVLPCTIRGKEVKDRVHLRRMHIALSE